LLPSFLSLSSFPIPYIHLSVYSSDDDDNDDDDDDDGSGGNDGDNIDVKHNITGDDLEHIACVCVFSAWEMPCLKPSASLSIQKLQHSFHPMRIALTS
jgi:hypothetical protein